MAPIRLSGKTDPKDSDYRTMFQEDWDRVAFSSAFRRLQGKTQVHPFPEKDYIHTRLTHSIETASVGRSLGYKAGQVLCQQCPELAGTLSAADVGVMVATGCLIHDIGNTPFGHSGEDTIQAWFRAWFEADPNRANRLGLSDCERADFTCFEGNAQGFRTVTRLQGSSDDF
ncbi:MAG: dNTP triphosphohydrolase, partial [Cyanobacteria bacterium HKST-UBA05]|nr:dNTP triphosphohydrolase [Cyanobacteria bacterium HKST-UBA05]